MTLLRYGVNEGITVNEYFQTTNPHIYAIGSICHSNTMSKYPYKRLGSIILSHAFKQRKKELIFPYALLKTIPEILVFGKNKKEFKAPISDIKTIHISCGKLYMRNV